MRIAIAVLTVSASLSFAVACSSSEESTITDTPQQTIDATPVSPGGAPSADPILTVGPGDDTAISIVETDPLMNELFPGRRVISVSPWYMDDEHRASVVNVYLDPPVDIDANLPYAYIGDFANEGSTRLATPLPDPGYELRSTHITMSGVQSLAVAVDVAAGRVIQILPIPFPLATTQ